MARAAMPPARDARLLWAVFQSMPHAVIAVETDGCVRLVNAAAKHMIGLELAQLTHGTLNREIRLLDGGTRQPIPRPFDYLLSAMSRGRSGIYDVLVRPDGSELPIEHSLTPFGDDGGAAGVLVVLRDASRTRDVLRRLHVRANHDALTGLFNRAEFERRAARTLAGITPGDQYALLYLDLDGFKHINDTHGHAAGDAVLRQVARILRLRSRAGDTLARLGGTNSCCWRNSVRSTPRGTWRIPWRGRSRHTRFISTDSGFTCASASVSPRSRRRAATCARY